MTEIQYWTLSEETYKIANLSGFTSLPSLRTNYQFNSKATNVTCSGGNCKVVIEPIDEALPFRIDVSGVDSTQIWNEGQHMEAHTISLEQSQVENFFHENQDFYRKNAAGNFYCDHYSGSDLTDKVNIDSWYHPSN